MLAKKYIAQVPSPQRITQSTSGTPGGCAGDSPAKRRRRARNGADAAAGRAGWISAADRKLGFERVLWYQDMSRVCPGCPQTTTREAREGSCIRKAYDEHPTSNLERSDRTRSHPKRHQSHPNATPKPPTCDLHATYMRPSSHLQARRVSRLTARRGFHWLYFRRWIAHGSRK
jgi:hypothetical protein